MVIQDWGEVTKLLKQWGTGHRRAESELFDLLYKELRRIAGNYMRREHAGHTLQPTAVVHEVYLRLAGSEPLKLRDRQHFFAVASQTMRHVLVDYARQRRAGKRGGNLQPVTLNGQEQAPEQATAELLAVHELLDKLAEVEARQAQIVELRYFGGLSVDETAAILGISPKTVKRDWSLARLWLHRHMTKTPS